MISTITNIGVINTLTTFALEVPLVAILYGYTHRQRLFYKRKHGCKKPSYFGGQDILASEMHSKWTYCKRIGSFQSFYFQSWITEIWVLKWTERWFWLEWWVMRTKRLNEHNDARCGMSRNEEMRRYVIMVLRRSWRKQRGMVLWTCNEKWWRKVGQMQRGTKRSDDVRR